MIRYALIGVLAVVILSMGYAAVDYTATHNSSNEVAAEIGELDEQATSLMQHETPPPEGHHPPQRTLTLELPRKSLTTQAIEHLELKVLDDNATRVEYLFEDGRSEVVLIDVPIVYHEPDNPEAVLEFGAAREIDIVLTLEATEDDEPVVVLNFL